MSLFFSLIHIHDPKALLNYEKQELTQLRKMNLEKIASFYTKTFREQ